MEKTAERVARPFPERCRHRPRAGLANDTERALKAEDFVVAGAVCTTPKSQTDGGVGHTHIRYRKLRQPAWQEGINKERSQRCERLKSQQRLHQRVDRGRGPSLGGIRGWIDRRKGMILVALVPGNTLRQP